jgi:hypothetical protein
VRRSEPLSQNSLTTCPKNELIPRRSLVALFTLCFSAPHLLHAEEIVPSEDQTTFKGGTVEVSDGIRAITGEADATGHGPITYYHVPFSEGTFSISWKVEEEQRFLLVFDGKANGKATHALKVYFNGGPMKNSTEDDLTLLTYDGSTKEKKKAKIVKHDYHADAGKWHEVSVSFEGDEATVVVGRKKFTVTSERFLEGIEKTGVGHFAGTLQTKGLKIDRIR